MINIPLIPTPWKIVAAIVALSLYTAFVFNKGYNYADGKLAKEANEAMVEDVKRSNEAVAAQLKESIAGLKKQDEIRAMFDGMRGDLEKSIREKPVYLNKDCTLDEHDLKLWNGEVK